MRSIAGSGVLLTRAGQVPVSYALGESSPPSQYAAEGQVFGEPGSLRPVYLSGPCKLRLEDGHVADIVLVDCNAQGVADVGVTGTIAWPE